MTKFATARLAEQRRKAGLPTHFNRSTGAVEVDQDAIRRNDLRPEIETSYSDEHGWYGWAWNREGTRRVRVFVPNK